MTRRNINTEDDDDPNRILRDGERISFGMMMKDGKPRFIGDSNSKRDSTPTRMVSTDALGHSDAYHLSRPGFRYLAVNDKTSLEHALHETRRVMRDQAYADARTEASNAWKGTNSHYEIPMSLDSAATDAREHAHEDYQNYISNAWKRK